MAISVVRTEKFKTGQIWSEGIYLKPKPDLIQHVEEYEYIGAVKVECNYRLRVLLKFQNLKLWSNV